MMKTAKKQRNLTETRQRFSIRKLTIGAASVMIGLTFMFVSGQGASAAETDTVAAVSTTTAAAASSSSADTTATSDTNQTSDSSETNASSTSADTNTTAKTNSATNTDNAAASTASNSTADTTAASSETANQSGAAAQTSDVSAQTNESPTNDTTSNSDAAASTSATTTATEKISETSKYNTADWEGTLDDSTNEYTLTKYTGTDTENVYIPNTQDFINAGTISADDKVYITKDLLQSITNAGAVNVAIDSEGEQNKVYAKGDLSSAMTHSSTLKSVDLSHLDTSEVTNASYMFFHDTALESANLSGWDLNKTSDLSYMFLDDDKLKSLNISNWQLKDGVKTTFAFGYTNNPSSLTDFNVDGVKNLNTDVLKTYVNVVKKTGATSIDLSNTTLSSTVTDLQRTFANLPNVKSINLSGWDTSKITNVYAAFAYDSALTDVNLSGWNLSSTDSLMSLFYNDSNLTNIDFSNVDFGQNISNEVVAFQGVNKLANVELTNAKNVPASVLKAYITAAKNSHATTLDLSNISLSDKITSLKGLFQNMPNLETINLTGLQTANVTDMSYMFDGDFKLKEIIGIGGLNTSKVTNMSHMFSAMQSLTDDNNQPKGTIANGSLTSLDLSKWDTSKVTNMSSMFDGQKNLQTLTGLANWNTSNVTDMSRMFANLQSLADGTFTGVNWDTSKVTDMSYMFYNMPLQKDLSFVNNFDTSNVTDMSYMFAGDTALKELNLSKWVVSKVGTKNNSLNYSLAMMFADDVSLTSVGDISNWDTVNVHSTRSMFYGTTALKTIDLSGWDTGKLQIAGNMFYGTGASEINISSWDLSNLTNFNDYGLVDQTGTHRGSEGMFADLGSKAVITMNIVTLPDAANAFIVTDFKGDQPIVVLANSGSALTTLNDQTWADEKGTTVTGRQNSNFVTYVDAAGHVLKTTPLNFVYTDAASLKSKLNNIVSDDKTALDTEKNAASSIKLLNPSENDSFLADFMTSKYQFTYEQAGDQGGSTDSDNPDSDSTVDPSDPAQVDPTDPDQTDNLKPKPETPDQAGTDSEPSTGDSSQNNAAGSNQGQTMPSGMIVSVKSQGTKEQQISTQVKTAAEAASATANKRAAQAKQAHALPQTGMDDHNAELWGLALLAMLGLGAYVDRKRHHN